MLNLEFINEPTSINTEEINRHLLNVLRRLDYPDSVNIEIKFCNKEEIQKLNLMYRTINSPTDVLSFNATDNPELLGSVAICQEVATIQADQAGISLQKEVNQLSAHGLLHLLGFDHK